MSTPLLAYILIGIMGVASVLTALFILLKPESYWRFYRSQAELWQGIYVERSENWGCWRTFNGILLLSLGIFVLGGLFSWIKMDIEGTQRNAIATRSSIQRPVDIAALKAIFTPLLPELKARAKAARGDILQFTDAERSAYGLGQSPVYFSSCAQNGKFYIVVKEWGTGKASYLYGKPLEFTVAYGMIGVYSGCGTIQFADPDGWTQFEPSKFVYEVELKKAQAMLTRTP